MKRAPRKTKRERKGPFVKPHAPAEPRELIYVELGGEPPHLPPELTCTTSAT